MNSEGKTRAQESTLMSSSLCSRSCVLMPVCEKPGVIKLSSSETDCVCPKPVPEDKKFCLSTDCAHPAICSIPATLSLELCECEDFAPAAPTCTFEERTHEQKGVQPAYVTSESFYDSLNEDDLRQYPEDPQEVKEGGTLYIEPHLKDHTPQSIDELKASVSGLVEKPRPLLECKFIEYRCEIKKDPCAPEERNSCERSPLRPGISLTMEPNDHRFCINPDDCKHTRPPPCPSPLPYLTPPLCPTPPPCSTPPRPTPPPCLPIPRPPPPPPLLPPACPPPPCPQPPPCPPCPYRSPSNTESCND